jgi:hypothetical protein
MKQRLGLVLAVSLASVAPDAALAQSDRTAAGVEAFVRGDYATAVEMLKPAAESWQLPYDRTAAFFMSLIYDNGLGVAQDPVRACALLLRTTAPVPGAEIAAGLMFAVQALTEDLHTRLGSEQMAKCMVLTETGFDRVGQRATFSLAPGHWISIDLSPERREIIAQIEHGGKQTDVELLVPVQHGVRFLPFSVTELTSLRPAPVPRYFLETFMWVPARTKVWTLMWSVAEIVRNTLVPITFEELQIVDGEEPPQVNPADLRRLAVVRVNADGDAEWVVLGDAERRIDVIETQVERDEIAAEQLARQAAEKKVDWELRRPPDRVPSLAYSSSSSEGCMGPSVFGSSGDRTEGIVLHLGSRAFEGAVPSTLIIGQTPGFDMRVHVYDTPQRRFPFCSDARMPGDEGEVWRAIAGTASVELVPIFRVREPETYRATIRLTGAEFVGPTGARVRQSQAITLSTIVRLRQ